MKKTKDSVISELNARLLTLEENLFGSEKEVDRLVGELDKASKKAEKYRELYMTRRHNELRAKEERADFARKLTELENKSYPKGIYNKLMFLIRN